jgi:cytochrome oxidase Cu insertion factor (SCO1/SenC/PrrC family)
MLLKKRLWLLISGVCITSAVLLELFPATAVYNKILGKPAINGFQSSFKLSNYPMQNQLGQTVTWSTYADRPLYITTGFTICSYTCPITMIFYQKLKQKIQDKAVFSLFTIDPLSDSPKVLGHFLEQFDPAFVGLQINNNVHFKKVISELNQSVTNVPESKDIIHSNYIYLLHPKLNGLVVYTEQHLDLILRDYKLLMNI